MFYNRLGDTMEKTNAMRILDQNKINYKVYEYPHNNQCVDGLNVANLLNQDPEQVFKTLVTVSNTKKYYVFLVPVAYELDLKKCAKTVNEKNLEMIHVKDLFALTGYVRGGCSPIGMKKTFTTVIHETAYLYDTIIFSGGKIGLQIEINPDDLINLLNSKYSNITK